MAAGADLLFEYDADTALLRVTVENTSPVTPGVANPVVTRFYFSAPEGLIETATLVGQASTSGQPPEFRLAFAPTGRTLDIEGRLPSFGEPGLRLRAALPFTRSLDQSSRSGVYVDDEHLAVLFDWVGPEAVVELEGIDRIWAGQPRADGERSLELFVRR